MARFGNNMFQSSNPALAGPQDSFDQYYGEMAGTRAKVQTATLQGVVNKTAMLVGAAIVFGAAGYAAAGWFPNIVWISCIASLLVSIGIFLKLRGSPHWAVWLAPIYAAVQGFFLGALTGALDGMLESMITARAAERGVAASEVAPATGLAFQAFVITISVMLAMLGLYYTRILQPTKMFVSVVSTLTAGIMIAYVISFVGAMFFGAPLPFLNIGSALQGGTPALIGLGLNVLILGVAAMWLIIDFRLVEDTVSQNAPKYMEWYCGFALIVTLAWIYFEAVKLAFRVSLLFMSQE